MTFEDLRRRIHQLQLGGASDHEITTRYELNIYREVDRRRDDLAVKIGDVRRQLRELRIMSAREEIDGMPISDEQWMTRVRAGIEKLEKLRAAADGCEHQVRKELLLV